MADSIKKLLESVQRIAYSKQKRMISKLSGKYVRRNGTEYLVVSIDGKTTVLSSTGTRLKQTQEMSTKAFLGKKIEVL